MIGPRDMSQSVLGCFVQPVGDISASSYSGLVGMRLEAYGNQWDCITFNVFVRSVVQNDYVLEFAEGNSPLSRVPLTFNST